MVKETDQTQPEQKLPDQLYKGSVKCCSALSTVYHNYQIIALVDIFSRQKTLFPILWLLWFHFVAFAHSVEVPGVPDWCVNPTKTA